MEQISSERMERNKATHTTHPIFHQIQNPQWHVHMFTFTVTQHIRCLCTIHPLRSCSCWCNFNSFFSTGRSRSRPKFSSFSVTSLTLPTLPNTEPLFLLNGDALIFLTFFSGEIPEFSAGSKTLVKSFWPNV